MEITLCLIVRNEEKNLTQCLSSFRELYAHAVVVDTGSTDTTKEVASKLGATVFDYVWHDDFAAARNFALSKAKSEWVMMADADDTIDPDAAAALKKELATLPADVWGIILPYLMPPYEGGLQVYKAKIWKRSLNARYKLAVHEYLNPTKDQLRHFIRLAYPLKHTTPPGEFHKSLARNLGILRKAVASEPDEPRYYFYLGHDNQYSGNYEEAVRWYKKYEQLPHTHADELNRVLVNKGTCFLKLGNIQAAQDAFLDAVKANPAFIDPYLHLAQIKSGARQYEEAANYYVRAMRCSMPRTHVFVNASLYHGYAQKRLTELLYKLKREGL